MSGESEAVTQDTQVSHTDASGRTLSGMGADVDRLAETMERHAPEPANPADGQPAAADQPPSRGRQRFADLTREREEARAETVKERAAREALEKEVAELRAKSTQTADPTKATNPATPAEQPKRDRFPSFDAWLAKPENTAKLQRGADGQPTEASTLAAYDDWLDARSDHHYEARRASEREAEARTNAQRDFETLQKNYVEKLGDARKKYADYDTAIAAAPKVSMAVVRAVMEIGPDAAYYLATHPDEAAGLSNDTDVDPNNPAFAATVATTRRFLSSVLAASQRTAEKPKAPAWTPPPAPHPSIGGGAATTAPTSAELAKKGDYESWRVQRAKERGVKPRY
jgi:hypothetical protein